MSIVVAVRYKNGVVIGSDNRATYKGRLSYDNCTKIITTTYTNHAIGTVGTLRAVNLMSVKDEFMEYKDILDDVEVDLSYMSSVIIPNLIQHLNDNHVLHRNTDGTISSDNCFIYATNNNIYTIMSDFGVIEMPNWSVIGCGEDMVMGLLNTIEIDDDCTVDEYFGKMERDDAVSLIQTAILLACKNDTYISQSCDIVVLEKDGCVIEEKDK